jgi:hypothetical protein
MLEPLVTAFSPDDKLPDLEDARQVLQGITVT